MKPIHEAPDKSYNVWNNAANTSLKQDSLPPAPGLAALSLETSTHGGPALMTNRASGKRATKDARKALEILLMSPNWTASGNSAAAIVNASLSISDMYTPSRPTWNA